MPWPQVITKGNGAQKPPLWRGFNFNLYMNMDKLLYSLLCLGCNSSISKHHWSLGIDVFLPLTLLSMWLLIHANLPMQYIIWCCYKNKNRSRSIISTGRKCFTTMTCFVCSWGVYRCTTLMHFQYKGIIASNVDLGPTCWIYYKDALLFNAKSCIYMGCIWKVQVLNTDMFFITILFLCFDSCCVINILEAVS